MPNNPAEDRYDPPNTRMTDFESTRWSDLEDNGLFWLSDDPNGDRNIVHRKVNDNQGIALRTGNLVNLDKNQTVYQKI